MVTGSSGFIGQHVVEQFKARGIDVFEVPHRWSSREDLASRLGGVEFGSCVHLGWYSSGRDYLDNYRENLLSFRASLQLVEVLLDRGVPRLVVAGSCAEYEDSEFTHSEDEPPRPGTPYGLMKVALWTLLRSPLVAQRLSTSWARLFNVVGPGEPAHRLISFVAKCLLDLRVAELSDGLQTRDFVDVVDTAAALVLLSQVGGPYDYNVCSGSPRQVREVAVGVGQLLGGLELLAFGSRRQGPNDRRVVIGEPGRLSRDLGWMPQIDISSSIERSVDWLRPRAKGRSDES
jgi:nucleoside-diphosphate-sugar epimerase